MTKFETARALMVPGGIPKASKTHFAPSNIALCKYWGKRDQQLNLPINPSLSVSLDHLGTHTSVTPVDGPVDQVMLNGLILRPDTQFVLKVSAFIDLFRGDQQQSFLVETRNTVPTAAGVASSASGFAALTLALNDAFDLKLDSKALSTLARLGSGSACRSIYTGFVEWQMGEREDGLDSHGCPIEHVWPGLAIGLVKVDEGTKAVDSRSGMQRTIETSTLYASWPEQAQQDLERLRAAIVQKDFSTLGSVAEQNALSMHATMISGWPPLLYWQPASISAMQQVWQLRRQGIDLYFTLDAGPNLKLIFQESDLAQVLAHFPDLEVVLPFGS